MVNGIFPRIGNDTPITSRMVWMGEESERIMCEYCKTVKLNRNGRFYTCSQCNQRFLASDIPEEIKVDLNISKLDMHPAMVFIQSSATDMEAQKLVRDELKAKYGINDDAIIEDDATFRRPCVSVRDEIEH